VTAGDVDTCQVLEAGLAGIGEAARAAGVSTRGLRYYEELRLVRPAAHSPGGHRLYGPTEIARVVRIRELQDLMGFNLGEIADVLSNEDCLDSLREAYRRDDDPGRRLAIATEGTLLLADLEAKVAAKQARLAEFGREIAERRARVEAAVAGFAPSTMG